MGVPSLKELFAEKYYTALPGGILESFGRLFKHNMKLYVYPLQEEKDGEPITINSMKVAPELSKLFGYLSDRGSFVDLDNHNPEVSHIFSRNVLSKIADSDPEWESMVPPQVAELIKARCFFGYSKR